MEIDTWCDARCAWRVIIPKYPKSKPPKTFDGEKATYYNAQYFLSRFEFTVLGDNLLVVGFRRNGKKDAIIEIHNFKSKTVDDIFKEHDEWGYHFEDGIIDIWRWYSLPFGFVKPVLKRHVFRCRECREEKE